MPRSTSPLPTSIKQRLGQWGESVACHYLLRKGYTLLQRNWRVHHQGEIDLIMQQGQTLVFVEVKTRHASQQVSGLEALTPQKKQRLVRCIQAYQQQHPNAWVQDYRMDWVLVVPAEGGGAHVYHTPNVSILE